MSAYLSKNNAVGCEIAIYPLQGGATYVNGNNAFLRSCTVSRPLRGNYGTCDLVLSPGGPTGTSSKSWTTLIQPYSLVVVGMTRGGQSRIVFCGIVTKVGESQSWTEGNVERDILVEAADFGYILATSSFYVISALLGGAAGLLPLPGILSEASPGLNQGTPDQIATAYYRQIVCSPPSPILGGFGGIFQSLKFSIDGKAPASFYSLVSTLFEPWDGQTGVNIPAALNFISSEEPFAAKFAEILTPPFYESWWDVNAIGTFTGAGSTAATTNIPPCGKSNYAPAQNFFVNRVTPLPKLMNSGTLANPSYSTDLTLWNNLPLTTYSGFIQSAVSFQPDNMANFFSLNALQVSTLFGQSNANLTPLIASQCVYLNPTSIEQFGYRPSVPSTIWFSDPTGVQARAAAASGTDYLFADNYREIILRLVGYSTPLPWMAAGTLTIPADVTVDVGQRVRFVPFKDPTEWEFYVMGVAHEFIFGDHMHTTLNLERGLPVSVYQGAMEDGQKSTILTQLLTGTASLIDGEYQSNPSGTIGIVGVSLAQQTPSISPYSTPQGGSQPSS
jgi:hypothetical protein